MQPQVSLAIHFAPEDTLELLEQRGKPRYSLFQTGKVLAQSALERVKSSVVHDAATLETIQAGILLLCSPHIEQQRQDGFFELLVEQAKHLQFHRIDPNSELLTTNEKHGVRCW